MSAVRLVKHRRLKNAYGSRGVTSEPRPATKPDLRRYRVRKYAGAPEDATGPERREYRVNLRRNRPNETRWRTEHGVCDRVGDVVTYTGECQRCSRWFAVDRRPAQDGGPLVIGSWPEFCSDDCREIHQSTLNRRNARRRRAGETNGSKRPQYREFDPEGMRPEDAYTLAQRIVDPPEGKGDRWATPTATAAAWRYIEEFDAETEAWQQWWKDDARYLATDDSFLDREHTLPDQEVST